MGQKQTDKKDPKTWGELKKMMEPAIAPEGYEGQTFEWGGNKYIQNHPNLKLLFHYASYGLKHSDNEVSPDNNPISDEVSIPRTWGTLDEFTVEDSYTKPSGVEDYNNSCYPAGLGTIDTLDIPPLESTNDVARLPAIELGALVHRMIVERYL